MLSEDPDFIYQTLGVANEMMGSYEKAIEYFLKAKENNRFVFWPQTGLLRCYIALGKIEKAHAAAAEVLRLRPNFSARKLHMGEPYKDQAEVERMVSAYLKAGLPE